MDSKSVIQFFGFFLISLSFFARTPVKGLELKNGAYEDLVIKVTDSVPVQDCRIVLDNLETTLTSASQYLFSALDGRAFFRSVTVLLPPKWPDSCASSPVTSASGEIADLTVTPRGPKRGRMYTQQSLGCGQPGDQVYLGYESLLQKDTTLARSLVKEFAMYRYGVFEEQGYFSDPIYPMCFRDDDSNKSKITGCSDLPIHDATGVCEDMTKEYNTTKMVDDKARSSIMFAAQSPSVSMFCDEGNHDRFAPTKHNSICQRRSVFDVIINHEDFISNTNNVIGNLNGNNNNNQITDTTPKITYKRMNSTRYVFVIENTKDMMQRESWSYLRLTMRYWALNVLPDNTEVGIVLAEEASRKALNIVAVKNRLFVESSERDKIYSSIPYTPSDSLQPGCIHCALKDALDMLNDRSKSHGPANSVIVVIAAGMNPDKQLDQVLKDVRKSKVKIAAINYPTIIRSELLNSLADRTRGVAYTVFEKKLNVDTTLLTTYFELNNVMYDITRRFYSGNDGELPMEILRRRITDDGRSSITGSFVLDSNMGKPSKFTFFTHNSITPLIRSLKLISPSHQVFSNRNDRFIDFKMIGITANISEPGTWTYTVEPYDGSPHPHFLQVVATPQSSTTPVVSARFWTHRSRPGAPLILLAEVKRGESPVLGAKVEVTVMKPEKNGSAPYKNRFELLDTGSGDPDITKGDGVYTRYFNAEETGPGIYTFEVLVTDNGNTAYTWTESAKIDDKPCCGSSIPSPGVTPISPFQRYPPKITLMITPEDIQSASQESVGRIGDLKSEVIPEDMKARLSWTAPDMGGRGVSRYEVKYAFNVHEIVDGFETTAIAWENGQPFPLSPGSETTFTLDMADKKGLLDKPLYFALKAFPQFSSEMTTGGPVSNWVRVLVPSPPPPPTVPPVYSSNEPSYWPNNINTVGVDPVSPSIAKTMSIGLELILPVAIGFILLVFLLVLYCYFCVVKRRDHRDTHKKSNNSIKNDKLSSTITIVPSTPQNLSQNQSTYTVADIPDPHTIGVPIGYDFEDDPKKRYSLVNQQEQQLIEELKQQQMAHQLGNSNNAYSGLSVISNSTLNRNGGHTLSPYNSWSASQLLHEHERRHSPMENMSQQQQQDEHQMSPHQELHITGPQNDHMSINGQNMDHMSLNGQHVPDHCHNMQHIPPPVPPLPAFNSNGYPVGYSIYGVHQQPQQSQQQNQHPIYQSMQRNETLVPFNPSLQGSMSSVNSGDKKRRNVTMV